jgi:BirA family transcriptional regulator, biotin operon repressor / biotin---[acetyl-CoA-carboxylase] ligase
MDFSQKIIELQQVDSTNNYALQLIKQQDAQHGTCIFAHHQTAGRGQMGKNWHTVANQNLTISIIIDINLPVFKHPFSLMALSGVACCEFVKKTIRHPTFIKWPNDVYINDKKAGGILVETTKLNNKKFAIVGIGLNVNQTEFDSNLQRAISLKQVTQQTFNLLVLTKELCNYFFERYHYWQTLNIDAINDLYNELLFKKDENIKLRKGPVNINGKLVGVNKQGELMIENALWDTFTVGSVEWVFD